MTSTSVAIHINKLQDVFPDASFQLIAHKVVILDVLSHLLDVRFLHIPHLHIFAYSTSFGNLQACSFPYPEDFPKCYMKVGV